MLYRTLPVLIGGLAFAGAGDLAAAPGPGEPSRPAVTLAPETAPEPGPSSKAGSVGAVVSSPTVSAPAAAAPGSKAATTPEPIRLSADPRPTLGPQTFVATVNAAEHYRALADAGGWPLVPAGATRLKAGERGAAVVALRQRLAATGDLAEEARAGDVLDETAAAALRQFQFRHGLEETGLVGPRTLHHLNVPAATRLKQLQASAARLMGSRVALGERYVVVNIPSAAVEAVADGRVVRRHVAVVGKADRPSPSVETRITSVNLNPTWTAPVSVIKKDIIPHVRKEPGYLARMKIRILDGSGAEIDPSKIDWSTERAANYTLRQDPGVDNSLGAIRLDMPNRHAVYMHDTPSKGLFARTRRLQSSGCVRVEGVRDLALWLLEGAPGPAGTGWSPADLDAAIATGARLDLKPARPVPVAWVYLTGYATADGAVHFRDDVYGLDEPSAPVAASQTVAPTLDTLITSAIGPAR